MRRETSHKQCSSLAHHLQLRAESSRVEAEHGHALKYRLQIDGLVRRVAKRVTGHAYPTEGIAYRSFGRYIVRLLRGVRGSQRSARGGVGPRGDAPRATFNFKLIERDDWVGVRRAATRLIRGANERD